MVTFARFMRALRADNFRIPILWLVLAVGLLSVWLLWLFFARVTVREVTDAAHLEANPATIASLVRGRVVASTLAIGKAVHAGDVLVELAAPTERLHLKEERARLAGIPPQLDALADEIAAQRQALTQARQAGRASLDEARANLEAAEEATQHSQEQAERLAQLGKNNAISELAILRAESKARSLQAAATSHMFAITRLQREQQTERTERRLRIERLLRRNAQLEAQRAVSKAMIKRLQSEIEKRRIRALITGRLVGVADLRVGAVVHAGEHLATLLPPGKLEIAANYPPSSLGSIRPGQAARMRLKAFPWTQYGSLAATVTQVASEARIGRIRVELLVHRDSAPRIPLQQGLPGTLEIDVEYVSPAVLVLRAARLLTRPSAREAL